MVSSRPSTNFFKNNIMIDQNEKGMKGAGTAYFHKLHAGSW
ncbi:hypothetical protein [Ignatzschineria indica]|nr:hypothetical protein [Ignatzschineria indica]